MTHAETVFAGVEYTMAFERAIVCPQPTVALPTMVEAILDESVLLYAMDCNGQTHLWRNHQMDEYQWSAHIGSVEQ